MLSEKNLFVEYFSIIEDPRIERTKRHLLLDIIAIALCAVISGADHWEEIEVYGQEKEAWLKTFLALPNGIPSHDTIARVFSRLNPKVFQNAFLQWVKAIAGDLTGEVIAIDGKSLRGTRSALKESNPIHLVSAWATKQHLSLGQLKVDEKTNEITAIPELLNMLVIKGAIITIDAMGCQREIAEQIKKQGGDYVLALKENQWGLYKQVRDLFKEAKEEQFNAMVYSTYKTTDGDHGRIETREYTVLPLMYLHQTKIKWHGAKSFVMVESCREIKGGTSSKEIRYYISSLDMDAEKIGQAIRAHWRIENNLHWSLDVTFREDASRIRKENAPENVTWLRRMALSLLKKEITFKGSIRRKRFKSMMDNDYLVRVLTLI